MVSDMHHLFSAQVTCNGFRSSYVFGTGDHTVKHLEGCGDLLASAGNSQSFFTPFSATGRGAVARASLYFMLRYPNEKVAVNNIKVGFKTLLLWASQNPPTLWEKHRNAAVFRAQGNRNPFIDFPDLPGQLDWSSIVN
jgi:endonuclease I